MKTRGTFWLRWGTALAAAAILTLALTLRSRIGFVARRDDAQIADLRAQIVQRDQTRRQAEDLLSQPENRTTRDQSQFFLTRAIVAQSRFPGRMCWKI